MESQFISGKNGGAENDSSSFPSDRSSLSHPLLCALLVQAAQWYINLPCAMGRLLVWSPEGWQAVFTQGDGINRTFPPATRRTCKKKKFCTCIMLLVATRTLESWTVKSWPHSCRSRKHMAVLIIVVYLICFVFFKHKIHVQNYADLHTSTHSLP